MHFGMIVYSVNAKPCEFKVTLLIYAYISRRRQPLIKLDYRQINTHSLTKDSPYTAFV